MEALSLKVISGINFFTGILVGIVFTILFLFLLKLVGDAFGW